VTLLSKYLESLKKKNQFATQHFEPADDNSISPQQTARDCPARNKNESEKQLEIRRADNQEVGQQSSKERVDWLKPIKALKMPAPRLIGGGSC
jgi:hypothetical protein